MKAIEDPAWVARKAEFDSCDDGHGPYLEWMMRDEAETIERKEAWQDFKTWAADNLGQGFSISCCEGWLLDQTTAATFTGFLAGRGLER